MNNLTFKLNKLNLENSFYSRFFNKLNVAPAPVLEAPVLEAPVLEAPVLEAPVLEAPVPVHEAPVLAQSNLQDYLKITKL